MTDQENPVEVKPAGIAAEIAAEKIEEAAVPTWVDNVKYASFYDRLGAFLVDFTVLLIPISFVLTHITTAIMGSPNLSQEELGVLVESQGNDAANMAALAQRLDRMIVEYALYGTMAGIAWVTFWFHYSATPGKMLFRIRIVDEVTGMPPTLKQYVIRYFGLVLSGIPVGLGFFWVQWNKRRRAWHDMMAGTLVVKKSSLPELQADATLAKASQTAVD